MDFELSEEMRQIRDTFARYTDERLIPRAAEIDEAHAFPREAFDEIAQLGFFRMLYPEDDGGLGLGMVSTFGAAPDVAAGFVKILPVNGWDCRRPLSVFYREGEHLPAAQRAFLEFLRAERPMPPGA